MLVINGPADLRQTPRKVLLHILLSVQNINLRVANRRSVVQRVANGFVEGIYVISRLGA